MVESKASAFLDIIEAHSFTKRFDKLVGSKDRDDLYNQLVQDPCAGVLLKGGGGLRKLRWRRPGMGKSGGVRIIYCFYDESLPLFLLDLFAKKDRGNLSLSEVKELSVLAQTMQQHFSGD